MVALCACVYAQTKPAPATVFRLGVFDGASNEFAPGAPHEPVEAEADGADAAKEWYAHQPAAIVGAPEQTDAAPRAVQFSISGAPSAAYRLHVALLIENRSVPSLRICVNGRCGVFYLESPLDARMGDADDTFESTLAPAAVNFVFPGSYLRRGSNRITFQVLQEKDDAVAGAGLTYDAIELDRAPASELPGASSAAIVPTVFYAGRTGSLRELVDVYIRSSRRFGADASATLTISGSRLTEPLRDGGDFGEAKTEFSVPEFAAGTVAHLAWKTGGRRFRKNVTIDPAKKWTLLVAPNIHLDVGYSDYQPKVAAIQTRAMDEAMDFARRDPGFCYSVDGSWDLDQFMKTRSAADRQRLIEAMRSRQLFVPAQYAELLTGFPTAEALIRSLYTSANFSRQHGTSFNYASITDVPSYSWSYASILAAAGIKYFIAGPNGHLTRAPVLIQGRLNEHSPFWWVGPDGGKVLFWYARHYWEAGILFGVPPEVNAGRQTVPVFLKSYELPSYRADAVIVYGTQQENTDLFPQQAQLAGEWNREFAYPRIQYSGFYAALKHIAAQFGNDIPTVRGDGGPYWEDGIASSARYAAMERRNESRAPSAEKLATLSSLVNPRLAADKADLDRMWTNIVLMDEHTWNSHDSYSGMGSEENRRQQKVKEMYAIDARQIADFVARNSMASLASEIPVGRDHLIVFNTLNWKRSALVTFDLEKGREIVDSTAGAAVPFEVLGQSEHLLHVRFMAANVPGVGYKVYELRPSKAALPAVTNTLTTTLESPYYRVVLDPASGAVRSIYDKQLGRELVNGQSPYRFGQYLYVSGGDRLPNTLLHYRTIALEPKLDVNGAHGGRLLSVKRMPYGWVALLRSTDTNTPSITTEIRLFENEKKIEFVENIDKTAVRSREAVYFAFPFAMSHPEFRYEIQTGVVNPARDMYPGAGHEWFSVQHWVSVEQDGVSGTVMPLDTPLVTLGGIYRGAWPSRFGERPGTIFSYAMNNYWSTNYNAEQGGRMRFRYVITSAAATDGAALSRMGWEEVTPLELDEVTRQDKALAPSPGPGSEEASYLDVSDPDLLVEDWKPAEDGNGTILRMLDLGGDTRQVTVSTPLLTLDKAIETDAVERNEQALPLAARHSFQFTVHHDQIVTVRLLGESGAAAYCCRVSAEVGPQFQAISTVH